MRPRRGRCRLSDERRCGSASCRRSANNCRRLAGRSPRSTAASFYSRWVAVPAGVGISIAVLAALRAMEDNSGPNDALTGRITGAVTVDGRLSDEAGPGQALYARTDAWVKLGDDVAVGMTSGSLLRYAAASDGGLVVSLQSGDVTVVTAATPVRVEREGVLVQLAANGAARFTLTPNGTTLAVAQGEALVVADGTTVREGETRFLPRTGGPPDGTSSAPGSPAAAAGADTPGGAGQAPDAGAHESTGSPRGEPVERTRRHRELELGQPPSWRHGQPASGRGVRRRDTQPGGGDSSAPQLKGEPQSASQPSGDVAGDPGAVTKLPASPGAIPGALPGANGGNAPSGAGPNGHAVDPSEPPAGAETTPGNANGLNKNEATDATDTSPGNGNGNANGLNKNEATDATDTSPGNGKGNANGLNKNESDGCHRHEPGQRERQRQRPKQERSDGRHRHEPGQRERQRQRPKQE